MIAWRTAAAIDGEHARLHFKIAGCERRLGNIDVARQQFRLASDLDKFSQGAPLSFNTILREVAERKGAMLVDVDAAFARASGDRLVGDDLFVDPLHPNLRGHQLIAAAVADELRRQGIPVPANRWRADAYVDPDPDALVAADQEIAVKELLSRAVACYAAGRTRCALDALEAARRTTRNPSTQLLIEGALKNRQ